MSITQQDVARESGVSISTVCLVLRDDPRISDRTRQRVLENATALGYVARTSLRAVGGHQHLGVLLANPSGHPSADTFFGEVLHGITEEAELQGQTVSIAAFDGAEPPRLARENRVHGLILGGTPIHPVFVERVRAMTVPSVFIGRYAGHLRLSAVLTDNSAGGQLATEHLLQLGRRQIAFVSGPLERALYADRLDGFLRAHREAGLALGIVRHGEATVEGGVQVVTELLEAVTEVRSSQPTTPPTNGLSEAICKNSCVSSRLWRVCTRTVCVTPLEFLPELERREVVAQRSRGVALEPQVMNPAGEDEVLMGVDDHASETASCVCVPKPSMPSRIVCPASRYLGGFISNPMPCGVSVLMTSPGCNVKKRPLVRVRNRAGIASQRALRLDETASKSSNLD